MMFYRVTTIVAVATALWLAYPTTGWAEDDCSPKALKRLKRMHKAALDDSFETGDFELVRKTLRKAIVLAREEGCDMTKEYAQILLDLGIFYLIDPNNPDKEQGRLYMEKAVKVDPCVKINPDLSGPEVEKELRRIKKRLHARCGGRRSAPEEEEEEAPKPKKAAPAEEEEDLDEGPPPTKLEHEVPDEAPRDTPLVLKCRVPEKVGRYKVKKVILFYRSSGERSYKALPFKNVDGYLWKVKVPASDVKGAVFQYYIQAQGSGSRVLFNEGSEGSPNIISLTEPPKKKPAVEQEEEELPEDVSSGSKEEEEKEKGYPAVLFGIGFRMGAGFLSENMCSTSALPADQLCGDVGQRPSSPGFAMGEMGGNIMIGYYMSENFVLAIEGKLGALKSDFVQEGSPWAVGGSGYLDMLWFSGKSSDVFRGFFGFMVGGGMMFHTLAFEPDGKYDTFQHGWIIVGAPMGVAVGGKSARFYGKVDPQFIFPYQSTFHIDVSLGVQFSF